MHDILISLGSNLGNSFKTLEDAIDDIASFKDCYIVKKSSFYKTKPVGFLDQDDFTNAAILVKSALDPLDLLHLLQDLEHSYKRVRTIKNGPRTLDLDIIAISDFISDSKELTLPHMRMHERAFVLVPCNEIAPDFLVLKHNLKIKDLVKKLDACELNSVELINA